MKLNWGHYIVIAFVLFAAMLTYFMIKGARNQGDLVAKDYYQQEVNYQQRIEAFNNAEALGKVDLARNEDGLCLVFPQNFNTKSIGEIHFYRPDNARLDFVIPLNLNSENNVCIEKNRLATGVWSVKIQATHSGKSYYWEESIYW